MNVGCVERDEACRATLAYNRPTWRLVEADVLRAATKLRPKHLGVEVGALGLIAGGPPCQPFSTASQWSAKGRQGMRDPRAATISAMLDLVETFLPRAILIENVAGFMRGAVSAKGFIDRRLQAINASHGVNYELTAEVINCADYGVPQNRHRVIGIATRDGQRPHSPERSFSNSPRTAWDALHDLSPTDVPVSKGYWTALLPSIPEGSNYQYLTAKGGGQELFGYRTRYWSFLLKLAKDQPSWTLPASPGPSTGPFHWDNRPLSIRERLRLQSFPDDWHLVGGIRDQVKQAGNATPPLLAEVFGRQLLREVFGEQTSAACQLLREPADSVPPPPTRPADLPEAFRRDVGPKTPHPGSGRGPAAREELA